MYHPFKPKHTATNVIVVITTLKTLTYKELSSAPKIKKTKHACVVLPQTSNMKKALLIITTFALPLIMQAQITLTASTAPSNAQCQVQDTMEAIHVGSVPDLSPKTNGNW